MCRLGNAAVLKYCMHIICGINFNPKHQKIFIEIKSMQAVRLIHQSFISSIKTGSLWDPGLQAEEYPCLGIKDGHACLPLSSAICTHTCDNHPALSAREQVKSLPQWFAQSHVAIQL